MGRSGDDPKVRRAAPGQTRPCAAAAARAEAGTARAARVAVRKVTQRARAQLRYEERRPGSSRFRKMDANSAGRWTDSSSVPLAPFLHVV